MSSAALEHALKNPAQALFELDKRDAEDELAVFVAQAWHVLEPGRELVWGWTPGAICDHLQAVTWGEIRRLIINVPPGSMKSLLARVLWPVWCWIQPPSEDVFLGGNHLKFLGFSYADTLSMRDNRRARTLVQSDWFAERWGDRVALTADATAKTFWELTGGGSMFAGTVRGATTGHRGDCIILDDANNVKKAESAADRQETNQFLGEVLPSRVNDQDKSPMLNIQQRTHTDDATGFLLRSWRDCVQLMIPMEFEPERKCVTRIGFSDPRTEPGELMWPERFSAAAVEEMKDSFREFGGTYAEAGQLQQRPAPREGGLFKADQFRIIDHVPGKLRSVVRYWDKAGSDGTGAYTAGVKMGELEDGRIIVLDVKRFRHSVGKREALIQATAEADGDHVEGWMEQEPGSGGKDSVRESIAGLAGYNYRADRVNGGDKEQRAMPFAAQVEIGNVLLLEGDWNRAYIEEHRGFPTGTYKDQVDASSGAYNKIAKKRRARRGGNLFVGGDRDKNPVATLNIR